MTAVSVVIPVFERLDYLDEALASVAAQTRPPDELVIVRDGGRCDPSPLLDACPIPAQVLTRPHGGPGAARNAGCRAAAGDVLAFLDVDDVWLPEKLELQLGILERSPDVAMVFAGVEAFYSPELGRRERPPVSRRAMRAGILPSTFVVRRDAYLAAGEFLEGVMFGDFVDWYAHATELGLRGTTVDRVLVRRRFHDHNAGIEFRAERGDYARVLKGVLDRRRGA